MGGTRIGQWRTGATYKFPNNHFGFDKKKGDSDWVKDQFKSISDKDGFRVDDCRSNRKRRLLQFLVPILSPNKPTTYVIKLTKAVYEAYLHDRKIGWGLIVHEMTVREALKIGGAKGCPLSPFVYMYAQHGLLTDREKVLMEKRQKRVDRDPATNRVEKSGRRGTSESQRRSG